MKFHPIVTVCSLLLLSFFVMPQQGDDPQDVPCAALLPEVTDCITSTPPSCSGEDRKIVFKSCSIRTNGDCDTKGCSYACTFEVTGKAGDTLCAVRYGETDCFAERKIQSPLVDYEFDATAEIPCGQIGIIFVLWAWDEPDQNGNTSCCKQITFICRSCD